MSLGGLKELRCLDLVHTDVTDAVLERLHGASHLTKLALGRAQFGGSDFSEGGLARLVIEFKSIRRISQTYVFRCHGDSRFASTM